MQLFYITKNRYLFFSDIDYIAIMGRNKSLSDTEKQKICDLLAKKVEITEITKALQRDVRTIKKAAQNKIFHRQTRSDKRKSMVSERGVRKITQALKKKPLLTSKQVFEESGLDICSRSTRCRVLKTVAKQTKPLKTPPLSPLHKQKRLTWARDHMKCDFSYVLFTDECRATLDGPDGWVKGWILQDQTAPHRLRRVMFWAGIVGDTTRRWWSNVLGRDS